MGGREKEKTSEEAAVSNVNEKTIWRRSHEEAHAFDKDKLGSNKSHEEACINDQVRRRRLKTEDLKEVDIRQGAPFSIDNNIDYTKEDAAAIDTAMLSLPTKFFGLRKVEQTGNFYYDADKIFDSNKEAQERQHLKKAATLVNEWIQLLQKQQPRPHQPASPTFTVSAPSMTAAGDATA